MADIGEKMWVAVEKGGMSYPAGLCNPSICYPEYPWGRSEVSGSENLVYDAVRKCFIDLLLDQEHMGLENWNPLGDLIKPGDKVLLKPNLVVSDHPKMDCIVTNPSVIRAVLDYVYIAMKGKGSVIVGDAPMQRCNFGELLNKMEYGKIIEFYSDKGIDIKIIDFRNFISDYSAEEVRIVKDGHDADKNFVKVDLGTFSLHCFHDKYYRRYRVTNYDYRKMKKYHNKQNHIYLIRKELLDADVIINLPKPKTHRKAGFTGALKNVVGTVVHKECLPHHIKGSTLFNGDEYLTPDFWKFIRTACCEQIDIANLYGRKFQRWIFTHLVNQCNGRISRTKGNVYQEGSWYGNDTIWRTFGDINRILAFSDCDGMMQEERQRKMITIADMIISGEKEGPVHASRKEVGLIIAGFNPVAVDFVIAKIMGFDDRKIPALNGMTHSMDYSLGLTDKNAISVLTANHASMSINDEFCDNFRFVPTEGWKHHIESTNQ